MIKMLTHTVLVAEARHRRLFKVVDTILIVKVRE